MKKVKRKIDVKKLCHGIKIIGFCTFVISIVLIITGAIFLSRNIITGGIIFIVVATLLLAISLGLIIIGFTPNFSNYNIKSVYHIEEISEEEFDELMSTKKTTKVQSKSIFENNAEEKRFCKFCGKEIDSDSTFCRYCGKEL